MQPQPQEERVYDEVEKEFREWSYPSKFVDKWQEFFETYQNVIKVNDKTVIKKPFIEQIRRMSTATPYIYSQSQRDLVYDSDDLDKQRTDRDVGRTIFVLDYQNLVNARSDIFDIHSSLARKEGDDKQIRILTVKVLCYQIRNHWDAAKQCMKEAVFNVLQKYDKKYADVIGTANRLVIVVHNFELTQAMGEISSQHLEKFVRIEALVPAFDDQSSIEIFRTVWRCGSCQEITAPRPSRKAPSKCPFCDEKDTMTEDVSLREVRDYMYFIAQDTTDKLRLGQMIPNQRNVSVSDEPFVRSVYNILEIGGYIAINGIVRLSEGMKFSQTNKGVVEIECVGIETLTDKTKYSKRIRALVEREIPPDQIETHYDKLKASYAPHLYGLETPKEILLLSAACGDGWIEQGGSSKIRGAMTMLLLGDSGTGKSELANFHARLNIHSAMVLGSFSSGVGLTASIKKIETIRGGDKIIRNSIDPGPYGITRGKSAYVVIDELDKVANPKIYEAISPAMDDFAMIYLDKNAAHTKIPVGCGSLHAANPITGSGRYDVSQSVFKQTNFATWLWSRYDWKVLFLSSKSDENRYLLWKHKAKTMNRMITETEYNNMDYQTYLNKRLEKEGIIGELDNEYYSFEYLQHELNYVIEKYPDPDLPTNSMPWLMMMKFWHRFNKISIIPDTAIDEHGDTAPFVACLDERSINAMIRAAKACARLHRSNIVTTTHMSKVLNLMRLTIKEFIPHLNLEELEEQAIRETKTLLNQSIRNALDYSSRQQLQQIAKFSQGLTKVMKAIHHGYFKPCKPCNGKGIISDKMGYSQDSAENPLTCHHCGGTRGEYKRIGYAEFEKVTVDTGVSVYCKDYFDLLVKTGFLVKDAKAVTTGVYYDIPNSLITGLKIDKLQKQIDLLFGVDHESVQQQRKILVQEYINKRAQ